jgi:hypothetical protein
MPVDSGRIQDSEFRIQNSGFRSQNEAASDGLDGLGCWRTTCRSSGILTSDFRLLNPES